MKAVKPYEGTIVCQSWNAEAFIKRAAKTLGWHQLGPQGHTKQVFHVRFDIEDLEGAQSDLKPNQFYNHFPCNR